MPYRKGFRRVLEVTAAQAAASVIEPPREPPAPAPASPALPKPRQVVVAAAAAAGVPIDRLVSRQSRQRTVVRFRAAASWILRHRLKLSLPEIGRVIGCDHSTVHYHLAEICLRPDTLDAIRAVEAELSRRATA